MDINKLYPIIAVDCDGTLHDEHYPLLGNPNRPLIKWLLNQQFRGAKIVLWTCREGKELVQAIRFFDGYGLVFDAINQNIDTINFYSRKPVADLYIDDKAVNVVEIMKIINEGK